MDELLLRYADQFGENFPMFQVRDMTEAEVTKTIQTCLDDGKPFEPTIDEQVCY